MEEKNAILVKANLDKDRLLTIAKSNIPKEVTAEILSIASSTDAMPHIKLTKREMQIAELSVKGMINKEIADRLCISERTVKNHISRIFKKIEVMDRTQAAVFAIKNKLINV